MPFFDLGNMPLVPIILQLSLLLVRASRGTNRGMDTDGFGFLSTLLVSRLRYRGMLHERCF